VTFDSLRIRRTAFAAVSGAAVTSTARHLRDRHAPVAQRRPDGAMTFLHEQGRRGTSAPGMLSRVRSWVVAQKVDGSATQRFLHQFVNGTFKSDAVRAAVLGAALDLGKAYIPRMRCAHTVVAAIFGAGYFFLLRLLREQGFNDWVGRAAHLDSPERPQALAS
jgi:hypothetical protein